MYQSYLGQLLTKRKSFGPIIINLLQLGIPTLDQKRFLLIGKERKGQLSKQSSLTATHSSFVSVFFKIGILPTVCSSFLQIMSVCFLL